MTAFIWNLRFQITWGIQHCCSTLHHFPSFSHFQDGYLMASFSPEILWPLLAKITLSATVFTSLKIWGAAREGTLSFPTSAATVLLASVPMTSAFPFFTWKKCFHWHQKPNPPIVCQVPFPIDSARTIYLKFPYFPQYSQFIPISEWFPSACTPIVRSPIFACVCPPENYTFC